MPNAASARTFDVDRSINGIDAEAAKAIHGGWRLLSIEDQRASGEIVYWMGAKPCGLIIYDPSGYMSVQFMRDPRPIFTTKYSQATPEEVRKVYQGYLAYFGTYEVNIEKRVITHHLHGSLRPDEVGIDYERHFSIEDDRLILTMAVPGKDPGRIRTLTWSRCDRPSI